MLDAQAMQSKGLIRDKVEPKGMNNNKTIKKNMHDVFIFIIIVVIIIILEFCHVHLPSQIELGQNN